MRMIEGLIDIVPNHVASAAIKEKITPPEFLTWRQDNTAVEIRRVIIFLISIPGQAFFRYLSPRNNYKPLGGENHPLSRWAIWWESSQRTGNGSRNGAAWFLRLYETVKVNYGILCGKQRFFQGLPEGHRIRSIWECARMNFWQGKDVTGSWDKFKDITQFLVGQEWMDSLWYAEWYQWSLVFIWILISKRLIQMPFYWQKFYIPAFTGDYIRKGKKWTIPLSTK